MLLTDLLRKAARLYPHRSFLRFYGSEMCYDECNRRVNRLAHAFLVRFGIERGDRVALLSRNRPEAVMTYLACAKIGAAAVPLNTRLHPSDYAYLLNDAEAKLLVLEPDLRDAYDQFKRSLKREPALLIASGTGEGAGGGDELSSFSSEEPGLPVEENDVAVQIYTGGMGGMPKGAMLSHRNLASTVLGMVVDVRFNVELCDILVAAPIFYIGALLTVFCAMAVARSVNLKRNFNPVEVLEAMSQEGSTHAFMSPTMIGLLLGTPGVEGRDFSRFRSLLYGAAPMPLGVLKKAERVFECELVQGYGLTESTGVLGLLLPEDHAVRPEATCREYSMAELRLVGPEGEPVKPGEVGEIVARGDGVMRGYWKQEEETRKVFVNGWLRTGDLATMDERGYITIVDRLKDVIISGGENIYPAEIERVIEAHPGVERAAVIAVPNELWGEEAKAIVVPKTGSALTEKALKEFCRKSLAPLKRPRSFELRRELPTGPTGDVLKARLKEDYWQGYEKGVN